MTSSQFGITRSPLLSAAIAVVAFSLSAAPAVAINVVIDYTYDTSGFFGVGNPQGAAAGAQARAALDAAAAFYSDILTDTFSPITVPAPFHSAAFDGTVTWEWTQNFSHPTTGAPASVVNASIAADDYVVYAGARNLSTFGDGSPGGYAWNTNSNGGFFTAAEINQINAITDVFSDQVERRGEASGFARWGGSIAFDSAPGSPWHYNHLAPPVSGALDFYTASLHELAHTLGFGESDDWDGWRTGLTFNGPNALVSSGGNPVPLADPSHWNGVLISFVYGGGAAAQTTLMSPTILPGIRRRLTNLDANGLRDVGWSVAPPVPEPASGVLSVLAIIGLCGVGRMRKLA